MKKYIIALALFVAAVSCTSLKEEFQPVFSGPKNPDPEHIPCYRVVNSRGELSGAFAFGGKDVQKKLLEADGIEVVNGTVDLKKYGLTQRDDKL